MGTNPAEGPSTKYLTVGASSGTCLCESASGLVRKLQGTGAKVSDQTLPV
jgi:hypothetical protein